jgi:hypothetical protein
MNFKLLSTPLKNQFVTHLISITLKIIIIIFGLVFIALNDFKFKPGDYDANIVILTLIILSFLSLIYSIIIVSIIRKVDEKIFILSSFLFILNSLFAATIPIVFLFNGFSNPGNSSDAKSKNIEKGIVIGIIVVGALYFVLSIFQILFTVQINSKY